MYHVVLGSKVGDSVFLRLSDAAGLQLKGCLLQINVMFRQIELHFDMALPGNSWEKYKINLPLRDIRQGTFILNSASQDYPYHRLFFETSVAPQMWKKSGDVEEEDLKDRVFWSEHEQWIRQCHLVADPQHPSQAGMDTRIISPHVVLPIGNVSVTPFTENS